MSFGRLSGSSLRFYRALLVFAGSSCFVSDWLVFCRIMLSLSIFGDSEYYSLKFDYNKQNYDFGEPRRSPARNRARSLAAEIHRSFLWERRVSTPINADLRYRSLYTNTVPAIVSRNVILFRGHFLRVNYKHMLVNTGEKLLTIGRDETSKLRM